MIIYEITVAVEEQIVEAYEKYMQEQHIPDLLATGYFMAAYFTRAAGNRYRVQYHALNPKYLEDYLSNDAERLRADFLAHFPSGVEVSRENWEIVKSWQMN